MITYLAFCGEYESMAPNCMPCVVRLKLVPDPLQTKAYLRAMTAKPWPGWDAEFAVRTRKERQQILHRPTPAQFTFYVHHKALRLTMGGAAIMHEQLLALLLDGLPRVAPRVVPAGATLGGVVRDVRGVGVARLVGAGRAERVNVGSAARRRGVGRSTQLSPGPYRTQLIVHDDAVMGILHSQGIRRVAGFCALVVAAVMLSGAVPATAANQINSVIVNNPGARSYLDTEEISIQLTASGGTLPYTWSATGLTGSKLSINASTGVISGPLLNFVGNWTVTVTATAAAGGSGSTTFGIHVLKECRTC